MHRFILVMCLLLAACSGGSSSGPTPPILPPPLSCTGTGLVDTTSFSLLSEVEPNDDISMAYGVTIPTPGPTTADSVGIAIGGNIHDTLDPVDTFSFTSSWSIKFFFKLCESTCNYASGNDRNGNPDSLDVSIAYFDVIDAAGNTMMSTQANNSTENYVEMCVDGGVITYIMVIANNTMNASQHYGISAFEAH